MTMSCTKRVPVEKHLQATVYDCKVATAKCYKQTEVIVGHHVQDLFGYIAHAIKRKFGETAKLHSAIPRSEESKHE